MRGSARPLLLLVTLTGLGGSALTQPVVVSPALPPSEDAAWQEYAAATDARIGRETGTAGRFLALDFGASAATDRQAVLAGRMPVTETRATRADGSVISVPNRWVHHWRGAVLLPRARLDHVFARLQAEVPGTGQGDVIASSILGRDGPRMRVYLKVRRTRFLTVAYNTEHLVTFQRRAATRGSSTSVATRIAELADAGTAAEREIGAGSEFLLRWNSYWRYEETTSGVIAECEAISLSRAAPYGTGFIVAPLVSGTARESMERALVNLHGHFQTPPAWSPAR